MTVALALIHADPAGRLYDQIVRVLPVLNNIFGHVVVQASAKANTRSLEHLVTNGVHVQQQRPDEAKDGPKIGKARRAALALALQSSHPFIFYCDMDRALHWAEHYPEEMARIAGQIGQYDFTVIGRTSRAFASHPRTQRDTEAIVNHVFAQVSGHAWDVTAAARGLSRHAAESILEVCDDEEISTDVTWPLYLQQRQHLSQGYVKADGLAFETADRYGDEIERAGGLASWLDQLHGDPRRWVHRLDMARVEVEAMIPFAHSATLEMKRNG